MHCIHGTAPMHWQPYIGTHALALMHCTHTLVPLYWCPFTGTHAPTLMHCTHALVLIHSFPCTDTHALAPNHCFSSHFSMYWCPCITDSDAWVWLSHWHKPLRCCLRMLADCIFPIMIRLEHCHRDEVGGAENTEDPQHGMVWILRFELYYGLCETYTHSVENRLKILTSDPFQD